MEEGSGMEQSATQRRERLRAMREEASLAGCDAVVAATPPDTLAPPLLSDRKPHPESPSFRFEFYTDPLAAFTDSRRNKKSRNSSGSAYGGGPPGEAPPPRSPSGQPGSTSRPNHPVTSFSSPSACFPHYSGAPHPHMIPSGNFSPIEKAAGNNQSSFHQGGTTSAFGQSESGLPPPPYTSISRGNLYQSSVSPGGFSNPSSSNPGSSVCVPVSAPYNPNGAIFVNSPASSYYSGGRDRNMAQSPQRYVGSMTENWVQTHTSDRSWGSFKQSPGSSGRGTPGKPRGRGFHRSQGSPYDSGAPASFAKRSMLEDPWKDLVPVRIDSVASRLDACAISSTSTRDWLPRSATKRETPAIAKGVSVCSTGPSLAESLAASFADAVAGEESS